MGIWKFGIYDVGSEIRQCLMYNPHSQHPLNYSSRKGYFKSTILYQKQLSYTDWIGTENIYKTRTCVRNKIYNTLEQLN